MSSYTENLSHSKMVSVMLVWDDDLTSWRHADSGMTVLHILFGRFYWEKELPLAPLAQLQGLAVQQEMSLEKIVVRVVQAGADCCARDNKGQSPTHIASDLGLLEPWQRALVRCGVDVKAVFEDSREDDYLCSIIVD
ncbi:hypothetical protein K440DRAFT_664616 [Wilcoxina mikolae CBS 423.85]|nr:hypothetical protein K440DRAFT_664616 [Wilcoxina mikolae CBS 423.85]